jgi:hypothetical protein
MDVKWSESSSGNLKPESRQLMPRLERGNSLGVECQPQVRVPSPACVRGRSTTTTYTPTLTPSLSYSIARHYECLAVKDSKRHSWMVESRFPRLGKSILNTLGLTLPERVELIHFILAQPDHFLSLFLLSLLGMFFPSCDISQ